MNEQITKEKAQYVSLPYFGIPKLLPYLKPYRMFFVLMVSCGLLGSAADIIVPLFQRYAINHFIALGALDTLGYFAMLYIAVILVQTVSNFTATFVACYIEQHVSRDLRQTSFNHLQTLSFSYFNQNSVGYIHARVMSDTARIGELVSWSMMDMIWHPTYIIGAMGVMLAINWRLALLIVVILPVATMLISFFYSKLTKLNRRIREMNSKITGDFNEGITGAKTIKTLVIEEKMARDFSVDTHEMKKVSVRARHVKEMLRATITFASSTALALVLWRGGMLSAQGVMEIGTLSVFISYALGLMEPIRWIIESVSSLITGQVNIERLTRLINTASDVCDDPDVVEKYGDTFDPKRENWEELRGEIEFCDVSFKYPDGDEYILEHFNLKIPQGSNIAIVGETGAGKSTLVNLVCRFFEPTSGKILIDGRDARERSQLWLHSNIGYVLQAPHLFSGSILENLRYGNPNATEEDIRAALKYVSADKIIDKLEHGLESEVGEGGDMLSTGEKQLLSFARAILADPKILVLDEATASVDTLTEQVIQAAISHVIEGRTSIVIAHRLSTIRNANCILVVRDGKIVERGTHRELIALKGYYHELYTRQYEEEAANSLLS